MTKQKFAKQLVLLAKGLVAGSGKYPELEKVAMKIANETAKMINKETEHVKSEMPYKAQYVLEEVVKILQDRI